MSKKVLSYKNLPSRLPVSFTLLLWLILDRIDPDGWVHGAVWASMALVWIAQIAGILTERNVDIFKESK